MKIDVSQRDPARTNREVVVALLPKAAGSEKATLPRAFRSLDGALRGALGDALSSGDFSATAGETLQLPAGDAAASRVYLLGLGDPGELDAEALRRAAGSAVKLALGRKAGSVGIVLPTLRRPAPEVCGQALCEGAALGAYRFDKYRTLDESPPPLEHVELLAVGPRPAALPALRKGVRIGRTIADAANFARDLANEPGSVHTPEWLAAQARSMGTRVGLRVRIYDERELERREMGALLAVGRGAANPPRMIVAEHNPAKKGKKSNRPTIALVGKGITFDSGGISIKPAANMDAMKCDMGGAAAVLGAMHAAAALKLPLHVVGIAAAAQNMPDGAAYLPGDVLKGASGKTIEVLNTDAEGRIALSDALHHATTFAPAAIIDVATLTGAKVIALGNGCCAVMGSNDGLVERIRAAGERSHERAWPLPLWPEHKKAVRSHIADVKNTAGREAGSITAAAFLSYFAGDGPWAHLDIAGCEAANKDSPYGVKGATGFGVRLLVELLRGWR